MPKKHKVKKEKAVVINVSEIVDTLKSFARAVDSIKTELNSFQFKLDKVDDEVEESGFVDSLGRIIDSTEQCYGHIELLYNNVHFCNGIPIYLPTFYPKNLQYSGDTFLNEYRLLNRSLITYTNKVDEKKQLIHRQFLRDEDEQKYHINMNKIIENMKETYNTILGGFREVLKMADMFRDQYNVGYQNNLDYLTFDQIKTIVYVRPKISSSEENYDQYIYVLDPLHLYLSNPRVEHKKEYIFDNIIYPETPLNEISRSFAILLTSLQLKTNSLLIQYGSKESGKSYCLYGQDEEYGIFVDLVIQLFRYVYLQSSNTYVAIRYYELTEDSYYDSYTKSNIEDQTNIKLLRIHCKEDIIRYNKIFRTMKDHNNPFIIDLCITDDTNIINKITILDLPANVGNEKVYSYHKFPSDLYKIINNQAVDQTILNKLIIDNLRIYSPANVVFFLCLNPNVKSANDTLLNCDFVSKLSQGGPINNHIEITKVDDPNIKLLREESQKKQKELEEYETQIDILKTQNNLLSDRTRQLKTSLEFMRSHVMKYNNENNNLQNEIDKYGKMLNDIKNRPDQLKQLINQQYSAYKTLKSQNLLSTFKQTTVNSNIDLEKEYMDMIGEEIKVNELKVKIREMRAILKK